MKSLEICLTPELLPLYRLEETTVVVVDILRATSCMTAGLSAGLAAVVPFADLSACLLMKTKGYFVAGERDGKKADGFDLGNSPFEYMNPALKGQKIAATTTNGTQAIEKSKNAKEILVSSFLNLSATANYLKINAKNVLIVCAGWKGKFSLEDTLYAGALAIQLENDFLCDDDSTLAAKIIYQNAAPNLYQTVQRSSHFRRLEKLGIDDDIHFCLSIDKFDTVTGMRANEIVAITKK